MQDGKYHLTANKNSHSVYRQSYDVSFNYIVEAEANKVGKPSGSYGLFLENVDNKDNPFRVIFTVSDQGTYQIWDQVNGETLIINQGNGVNHFKIMSKWPQMDFYINDEYVKSIVFSEDAPLPTKVGLVAGRGDANFHAQFDNFIITAIP